MADGGESNGGRVSAYAWLVLFLPLSRQYFARELRPPFVGLELAAAHYLAQAWGLTREPGRGIVWLEAPSGEVWHNGALYGDPELLRPVIEHMKAHPGSGLW